MILGGLAGGIGSDILMRQAAPEIYEDYVGDTATGEAVRFFSESRSSVSRSMDGSRKKP